MHNTNLQWPHSWQTEGHVCFQIHSSLWRKSSWLSDQLPKGEVKVAKCHVTFHNTQLSCTVCFLFTVFAVLPSTRITSTKLMYVDSHAIKSYVSPQSRLLLCCILVECGFSLYDRNHDEQTQVQLVTQKRWCWTALAVKKNRKRCLNQSNCNLPLQQYLTQSKYQKIVLRQPHS